MFGMAVAVAVLCTLPACGGSDGSGGDPTTGITTGAGGSRDALAQCLAAAGFPQAPGRRLGQPGDDPLWTDEKFIAAHDRCARESGMASSPPHGSVDTAQQDQRIVAFVGCMRQRGWQLPEPKRTTGPDGRSRLVPPALPEDLTAEKNRALNGDVEACTRQTGLDGAEASHPAGGN